jgi:hypothetical protein
MPDPQPASWRSIVYGTPVISVDNEPVGEVREVLGSDGEDIFHGLRVRLSRQGREVMVAADDVTAIFPARIETGLTQGELAALAVYDETATYHLASVGWLRKHLGWQQDSESDEEPG